MTNADLGFFGEKYATEYLEAQGYELIDHNYRKPWGEIDLIVSREQILVFVEVKANSSYYDGFAPEVRANHEKMQKVHRTARTYLAEMKYPDEQEWQIDIVSVTFNKAKGSAKITHFKNIEL